MRSLILISLLATLAVPASAEPSGSFQNLPKQQPTAEDLRNLPNPRRSIEMFGGGCEHLEFDGADQTARCGALLTSMHYVRGQSFQFWITDRTGAAAGAISFFGFETIAGQPTTTLAVELITIAEGNPPAGREARGAGTCQFGDLAAGASRVSCQATIAGVKYGAVFVTDGKPPLIKRD